MLVMRGSCLSRLSGVVESMCSHEQLRKALPSYSLPEEGGEMQKPRGRSWRECLGLGKIQRPLRERVDEEQPKRQLREEMSNGMKCCTLCCMYKIPSFLGLPCKPSKKTLQDLLKLLCKWIFLERGERNC